MRLGWCVQPDGIRVQQTHYTALSAWLSCVKDEIYIRGMEDVTEISGPSLVIRTQTQTLSIIQFTCEKCEIESADPPTDKIQAIRLGWMARERREANILQYLWKYFTKNIEAWAPHGKVKFEIIVHKPRMKKVLLGGAEMWKGMWGVKLLTDDILSVSASEDQRITESQPRHLEEINFHYILQAPCGIDPTSASVLP